MKSPGMLSKILTQVMIDFKSNIDDVRITENTSNQVSQ